MYIRHGLSRSRLNRVYWNMIERCYNENDRSFPNYGKRGIKVCDEWKNNFLAFVEWAVSNGYVEGLSLDRQDNNGDYTPTNCRWVTRKAQQNNRRNTVFVEFCGVKRTLSEWSDVLHIPYNILYQRVFYNGWSVEKAFTTVYQGYKKGRSIDNG